jgi:hypothetical protein
MSDDPKKLLEAAAEDGVLSPESMRTLTVVDLGAQIQAGLGVSVDDVHASEVVLVTVMPDDSGSIRMGGNAELVRQGHNQIVQSLTASKQVDSILFHTRYLNGEVLNPFGPIARATLLDKKNFDPNLGTPLYDQTVVLLGTVLAKAQEFAANGVPARTVTLLITDGADGHSQRKADEVASIVRDLRRAETHIVAAMGIDDGTTDFRAVFRSMGIEDRWILTPGATPKEIRQAFQIFSQSAVRASQGAAAFHTEALGGFSN